jgi:UDP-GlcNAc:undecaprenyl-phosphate GlcNAc-1-phosphate transferase
LKVLKDRQVVIKVSENMIELLFPLLLIVTCALPAGPPVYLPAAAAGLVAAVVLIWLFRPPLAGSSLRVVIYFFLPLVIYYAELQPADWIRPGMMRLYHLSFGVLVFFAVITLKSTRRQAGFKLSPLDFIILFVAVLVPNLPDPAIRHFHLGLLAVKIIVIFFVFEVLIGELRGQLKRLGGGILIALAVLAVNGFLS